MCFLLCDILVKQTSRHALIPTDSMMLLGQPAIRVVATLCEEKA